MSRVLDKLKFPQKTEQNLGSRKDVWCMFCRAFRHNVEQSTTLGHQLAELAKDGFLKEYLEESQERPQGEVVLKELVHETSTHRELNTIFGEFSRGGSSATKHKLYVYAVMSLETRKPDCAQEPALCFTGDDLEDVVSHENDLVVISVVTVGRKVHRVLIDQGSSVDMMFWETFVSLQVSPNQLRPYDGCLVGFAGDQVEV